MQSLMFWSMNHPRIVIILLIVISIFALLQLPSLRIDASINSLMSQDNESRRYYQETLERFGSDKITLIFIEDKNLFSPEKLKILDELVYTIEQIPDVEHVESLLSVSNFRNENGALISGPLIDWLPENQEEANQIRTYALDNPILVGNLVSGNGSATVIHVYKKDNSPDTNQTQSFSDLLETVIGQNEDHFEAIFQFGNTYLENIVSSTIIADQVRLVPISVLVIMITLVLTMGSLSAAILPMLTAGISIVWTMGFMGLSGIPLNTLTAIVPSLLIVIGSTEDIHLVSEYLTGLKKIKIREKAVEHMIRKISLAVVLTSVTTFIGFLSISLNPILILKQFGLVAAFGLLVNPIITILVSPIYLRYRGPTSFAQRRFLIGLPVFNIWIDRILHIILKHKVFLLSLFGVILISAVYLTFRVRVDNSLIGFFKSSSEARKRCETLEEKIGAPQQFNIRIVSQEPSSFKNADLLRQLLAIQTYLDNQEWTHRSISLADYIALIHREMNGGEPSFYSIPDEPALISQYALLLHRNEIQRFVTPDYSEVNIVVAHQIESSNELNRFLQDLEKTLSETISPQLQYGITGESILINSTADTLAEGQIRSLGLLMVIIFLIMSFLFLNVRAGFLSMIPNIFPIVCVFGIMGLFNIPLDTGTAMVAVMAIGIALDDTIHVMTRYYQEMRRLQNNSEAIKAVFQIETRPVISTSLALAFGFLGVCLSSFVPIIHFGALSALVMILAMMGDLFITPILLSSTQLITIWDMIGLRLRREVVSQSRLFEGLRSWQIKKIILLGEIKEKTSGGTIIHAGEFGSSLFLLLEGQVEVQLKSHSISQINTGEIFGEIALVNPGPRSADVIAVEAIKYIEINWPGVLNIQRRFPRLAGRLFLNLAAIIADRLVQTDKHMLDQQRI